MLPKSIVFTIFATINIVQLAYGWRATLYQYTQQSGFETTFSGQNKDCRNIGVNLYGGKSYFLFGGVAANAASSVNTYGTCVKLWTEWDCEGAFIEISARSPHHNDFSKLFDNRGNSIDNSIGSIGECGCSVPSPENSNINYVSFSSEPNYCGSTTGAWPNHPNVCTNINDDFDDKALSVYVHSGCVTFYEHKYCTGRKMAGKPIYNEVYFKDLSTTRTGSDGNEFYWGKAISSVSSCDYSKSVEIEGICQQDGIGTTSVRKGGDEYACLVIFFTILQRWSIALNVLNDFQSLVEHQLSNYGTIDWCNVKALKVQHFAGPRRAFNEYINALTRTRALLEQWFESQDHWYYTGRRSDVMGMIDGAQRVIRKRRYDIDHPKNDSEECVTRHREILEYWEEILTLLNEWRDRWGYN